MRPRILYCDDQKHFFDEFNKAHSEQFDIEYIMDIKNVREKLDRMDKLPDLVLLDLYHPLDVPDYEDASQKAKSMLSSLTNMIDDVREAVNKAWFPLGVDVLDDIRSKYSADQLPVMIYTQRGLLLLSDEKIRRVEELGADWLLKEERITPATRAIKIKNHIRKCSPPYTLKRDVLLMIFGTILGALLSYLTKYL